MENEKKEGDIKKEQTTTHNSSNVENTNEQNKETNNTRSENPKEQNIQNEANKNEINGGRYMEEIDMRKKLKDSFEHAMITEKYLRMALDYVLSTNPTKIMLENVNNAEDINEVKEVVKERVKVQMVEWMGTFEDLLQEGRPFIKDIMGTIADLAKENRNNIKKTNG